MDGGGNDGVPGGEEGVPGGEEGVPGGDDGGRPPAFAGAVVVASPTGMNRQMSGGPGAVGGRGPVEVDRLVLAPVRAERAALAVRELREPGPVERDRVEVPPRALPVRGEDDLPAVRGELVAAGRFPPSFVICTSSPPVSGFMRKSWFWPLTLRTNATFFWLGSTAGIAASPITA